MYSKSKATHNTPWEFENGGFTQRNASKVSRLHYGGGSFKRRNNHWPLRKTRSGRSRDYRDTIVFENLCCHDGLRWMVAAFPTNVDATSETTVTVGQRF